LREVSKSVSYNRVHAADLAAIFARCLMRPHEALERKRGGSSQNNIPFDLPQWITGEKKDGALLSVAEKVVLNFIQAERAFTF